MRLNKRVLLHDDVFTNFKSVCLTNEISLSRAIENFMMESIDKPYLLKNIVNFSDDTQWDEFVLKCEEEGVKPKVALKRLLKKELSVIEKVDQKSIDDSEYIKHIKKAIKKDKHRNQIAVRLKTKYNYSRNLVDRVLRDYEGVYWSFKTKVPRRGGRPTRIYKLI